MKGGGGGCNTTAPPQCYYKLTEGLKAFGAASLAIVVKSAGSWQLLVTGLLYLINATRDVFVQPVDMLILVSCPSLGK